MTNNLPEFDELSNIRNTLTDIIGDSESDAVPVARPLDRKRIEDTIFELITMGYVYGITVAGLDLEEDIPVDRRRMLNAAEAPTKDETPKERISRHMDEYERTATSDPDARRKLIERLSVVAETETHRTINEGEDDGARDYAERHPSVTIYKTWVTMGDDRVRDTHDYLEGATIPMDARFYTYDGDSARFPGDFMLPENVINCRCILRYSKQ
jgi:hypothetical protein